MRCVFAASIPTAKLVFAKVAVVRHRYGVPHIIFRVGNARGNFLWDPQIQLSYVFWQASPEGEVIQTVSSLHLGWSMLCHHAHELAACNLHIRYVTWPALDVLSSLPL